MRILMINDSGNSYGRQYTRLGHVTHSIKDLFEEPGTIHLIAFTGGEDVSPEFYGHRNLNSGVNLYRDRQEKLIFEQALEQEIPMTGICRGSQFLNVMCGAGTMVQDLRKPHGGSPHLCETYDGHLFEVTSTHHQMIVPGPGGQVLAWAEERLRPEDCLYDGELPESVFDPENPELVRVTEAIYYPEQKVFGVQGHPEYMRQDDDFPRWYLEQIKQLLFDQRVKVA